MPTYCIVDCKPIPEERERRKSTTCCDECRDELNKQRRERKDTKVCRLCARPSTPEERILFNRWRRETFPPAKRGRPPIKPQTENTEPESQESTEANLCDMQ